MLYQMLFAIVLAYGVTLFYSAVFVRPAQASVHAVAKEKVFTLSRRYDRLIAFIAGKLLRFVRVSEYKRNEYLRMLAVLGLTDTPEEYVSKTFAKAVTLLVGGFFFAALSLLLAVFIPRFSLLVLVFALLAPVFAIIIYWTELHNLKKRYLRRKIDIELELPKLCSVINSRLQSTSNIHAILSTFLPIANEAMAAELTVTLTDIKTGNVETALRRFEARISSPKVSDVVRGLIAVQHGDDMRLFFQSKQYQFNNDYITVKKKSVLERPMKLGLPQILVFVFCLLLIGYPMMVAFSNYGSQIL